MTLSFNLVPAVALSQAVDAISALSATSPARHPAGFLPGHRAGLPGVAHLDGDVDAGGHTRHLRGARDVYESFIHPITILSPCLPPASALCWR